MNMFKLSLSKLYAPPGTPIYTGIKKGLDTKIIHSILKDKKIEVVERNSPDNLVIDDDNTLNWIDVTGAINSKVISELGKKFNIHSLFIEDILNINQNPKIEFIDDNFFIILRVFDYKDNTLQRQQLAIFVSQNNIFTFQEGDQDLFKALRLRMDSLPKKNSEFLLFSILDNIFDSYHKLMSDLYDKMEALEINLFEKKNRLEDIYNFRVDIIKIRTRISYILQILKEIIKSKDLESDILLFYSDIEGKLKLYFDELNNYDERLKSLIEIFVAISSEKMNKIMKILTIISSIFIPLSFIAGIYGMNFEYMPGLEYKFGFYLTSFAMIFIGIIMLVIFKIKNWLN